MSFAVELEKKEEKSREHFNYSINSPHGDEILNGK